MKYRIKHGILYHGMFRVQETYEAKGKLYARKTKLSSVWSCASCAFRRGDGNCGSVACFSEAKFYDYVWVDTKLNGRTWNQEDI